MDTRNPPWVHIAPSPRPPCPSCQPVERTLHTQWEMGRKGSWVRILQVSPFPMTPPVSTDHVRIHPPREERR